MLRGAIFDFDGVLVDSERAHFEALRVTLEEGAGFSISLDEYAENYLAYDDHGCIRRALERHGKASNPEVLNDLATTKERAFAELLPDLALLPGAKALVLALHAARVPLAVASSALRIEVESVLRGHDLLPLFRGVVAAEDVGNLKPHPEPYLRGRTLVDAADSPRGVVAFEDSVPGIASARAAGLRVVGVTTSHPREKLALAHLVVDSLSELSVEDVTGVASAAS